MGIDNHTFIAVALFLLMLALERVIAARSRKSGGDRSTLFGKSWGSFLGRLFFLGGICSFFWYIQDMPAFYFLLGLIVLVILLRLRNVISGRIP